jgi:hypothetical protein
MSVPAEKTFPLPSTMAIPIDARAILVLVRTLMAPPDVINRSTASSVTINTAYRSPASIRFISAAVVPYVTETPLPVAALKGGKSS